MIRWKLIQLALFLILFGLMFGMSLRAPMWMDEYVFYRLSSGLPNYASTSDWFFKDRPAMLEPTETWQNIDKNAVLQAAYDAPLYPHTPLAPILVWPVVKTLNILTNAGVIKHIEDEPGVTVESMQNPKLGHAEVMTVILRFISLFLVISSLWLIFRVMLKKVGSSAYAMFLPLAVGVNMLKGIYFFYWDAFMMFFFVLTLYLMETRPKSKWKYVTACALVNTKMFLGIAFLAPLVLKAFMDDRRNSWKMLLPVLSILPFYIVSILVMHDPLYLFKHYAAQVPIHNYIYTINTPLDYFMILVNLGIPLWTVITLPILAFAKKYLPYVAFFVLAIIYAWATGLGITHMSTMVYAGALIVPLVAYEFKIFERLNKLLNGNDDE